MTLCRRDQGPVNLKMHFFSFGALFFFWRIFFLLGANFFFLILAISKAENCSPKEKKCTFVQSLPQIEELWVLLLALIQYSSVKLWQEVLSISRPEET